MSMREASIAGDGVNYDPTFLSARREAIIIFIVWVVCFLWSVPFCYLSGYGAAAGASPATIWGIPTWVVWGIALPWLVADVFTIWMCLRYMTDDEPLAVPSDSAAESIQ